MTTTLKNLLHEGLEKLAATSDSARLDAEVLLCHVLDISRAQLFANPEGLVDEDEAEEFHALIRERSAHKPLAHLTGYREFWSLLLEVSPDVLVPRPETELLVEKALENIPLNESLDVLDLGTGSGAIPVALSTERTRCKLTATDASTAALTIARKNAAEHADTSIEFIAGSWFEPLGDRRFDLIISNPPYVATGQPELTDKELDHEPAQALYSGADGLDDIRILIKEAPPHMNPGGRLMLEHGFDQAEAISKLMQTAGFQAIKTHNDLAGHPRVTEGRLSTPTT